MTSSLVGSEMCIRDSHVAVWVRGLNWVDALAAKDRDATFGDVILEKPVSYTHLTLPTICSV
eukprot:1180501-Prorocentrum_lima.AAC.1